MADYFNKHFNELPAVLLQQMVVTTDLNSNLQKETF